MSEMTDADIKFRLYVNHDRSLLFSGSLEGAIAEGMRVSWKRNEITWKGRVYGIVNRVERAGDVGYWLGQTR